MKNQNTAERTEARKGLIVLLFIIAATFYFWGGGFPFTTGHPQSVRAAAGDDWKQEFEDVCALTQDAMSLSIEELNSLIRRCDALQVTLEKLDESTRKVYLRRLKRCRDLYNFVLDSKRQK